MSEPFFDETKAERTRCAAICRGMARAERNRARSYRSTKNHPELEPLEREVMARLALEAARELEAAAKAIESGEAPPQFADGGAR